VVPIIISLDAFAATIVYVIVIYFFLTNSAVLVNTTTQDYKEFEKAAKLFQISEILMTSSNMSEGGLAEYEDNTVKHHQLSNLKILYLNQNFNTIKNESWKYAGDLGIKIRTISGNMSIGNLTGFKITRYGLCEGRVCILELYG